MPSRGKNPCWLFLSSAKDASRGTHFQLTAPASLIDWCWSVRNSSTLYPRNALAYLANSCRSFTVQWFRGVRCDDVILDWFQHHNNKCPWIVGPWDCCVNRTGRQQRGGADSPHIRAGTRETTEFLRPLERERERWAFSSLRPPLRMERPDCGRLHMYEHDSVVIRLLSDSTLSVAAGRYWPATLVLVRVSAHGSAVSL